jgi:hypothetical protein
MRVCSATNSGDARALETVEMDAPATRATSRIVTTISDTTLCDPIVDAGCIACRPFCKRLQCFVKPSRRLIKDARETVSLPHEEMPAYAHPRRSGSREQRRGRRVGGEVAALEDASEEIRALFAAVEPVAALARVCL